jgi:thiamine-phosphate pyrophosphorylase
VADTPRDRLAAARLYLCVGARPDLADFLDEVLPNGVDVVQLREKGLEARDEIALCEVVRDAARRHGALFAVNDRADLARAVRADVLHLGQRDLPVPVARAVVGDEMLVGLSSHTSAETSAAAVADGVDYFCAGPTWATPTKPGRPAAGLALLDHAASVAGGRPWFAIGGIDATNLSEVLARGATRVVVVRALTEAADPAAAARDLAARLRSAS